MGEGHLQEQQKEAWNIPPGGWGESLSPQSFAAEGSGVVGGSPPPPKMMIKRTFFGFPQSVTHDDDRFAKVR